MGFGNNMERGLPGKHTIIDLFTEWKSRQDVIEIAQSIGDKRGNRGISSICP
jgi:hypothetical protein